MLGTAQVSVRRILDMWPDEILYIANGGYTYTYYYILCIASHSCYTTRFGESVKNAEALAVAEFFSFETVVALQNLLTFHHVI